MYNLVVCLYTIYMPEVILTCLDIIRADISELPYPLHQVVHAYGMKSTETIANAISKRQLIYWFGFIVEALKIFHVKGCFHCLLQHCKLVRIGCTTHVN